MLPQAGDLGNAGNPYGFLMDRDGGRSGPAGTSCVKNPNVDSGGHNNADVLRSAAVAAGVRSGWAPFGFMIARLVSSGLTADTLINLLEEQGVAVSNTVRCRR
jgi:hypothetical protein